MRRRSAIASIADGSRGFFHPDNFTFGQPVYLSQLYAAIEAVQGVLSAFVTHVPPLRQDVDNGELAAGVLPIGPWEIARLDNDPSFRRTACCASRREAANER